MEEVLQTLEGITPIRIDPEMNAYRVKNKLGGIGVAIRRQMMGIKMGTYDMDGKKTANLQATPLIQTRSEIARLLEQEVSMAYPTFTFEYKVDEWFQNFEARVRNLIEAFTSGTDLSRLGLEGIEDLIRLAARTSLDETYLSKMEIRIGMGVDDQGVSDRVGAYLIPAIRIIKNLDALDMGSLPKVLIYSAAESVIQANGLDRDRALQNRAKIFEQCEAFLKATLPPNLWAHFMFANDRPQPFDLEESVDGMATVLEAYPVLNKLVQKPAERRIRKLELEGEEAIFRLRAATKYAAKHAFYSAEPFTMDLPSILEVPEPCPEVVFMLGGEGEEPYYRVRKYLDSNIAAPELDFSQRAFRARALRIQGFMPYGNPPPYLSPIEDEGTNSNCINARKAISLELQNQS